MIHNFLHKLQVFNYKNIVENEFIFDKKINCLVGDNGVGKTNVLDTIYHLSIGKSYFKTKSEKALDIAITPNRADCLGVRGIARDLASSGLGNLLKLKKKSLKQRKYNL